jgi:hypothetical protein
MCVIQTSNVYVPFEKVARNGGLGGLFSAPSPPFLRGSYFGSTNSIPKMDSSLSTLRIMARGII